MALKTIDQNPLVTDTILLQITTPDANGCLISNPYELNNVTIYYVERDYTGQNYGSYVTSTINESLQSELDAATAKFCADPSQINATNLSLIEQKVSSSAQSQTFYYKDRVAVTVIGTSGFPAWLSSDTGNAMFTLEPLDANGNTQYGHFSYEWNPNGAILAGDYFMCWTWTPLSAGSTLSNSIHFYIDGDPGAVATIPTHVTPPYKYDVLLERYLPEIYKTTLAQGDLTPQTTDNLNKSIAAGFTFMENLANQIIDLLDANVLNEALLTYLSNMFALKLRSSDPTLWRRQIKEAVPLFKKKGTLGGLQNAFAQAGMQLNGFTQYWQLVSPYTWTESFMVQESATFHLSKNTIIMPIDDENFGLWIRRAGKETYTQLADDYVIFSTEDDGVLDMIWVGDELSANQIQLYQGDYIKVMYQYNEVPGPTEQGYENYIRSLPLMDQRDEASQTYPPKNWNVKLISETDPLFNILVPVRNPFYDPIIFGHVRTEFAYSENIYNMEEYNGSTRPSYDPCMIDKSFTDPCGSCLSSSYTVDIGVEELCNDRMLEAQDILREYTPFHAQVYSLNFTGEIEEFVPSPIESINTLISIDYSQYTLSGNSNQFFTRIMQGGLSNWIITRKQLTDEIVVLTDSPGNAYNDHVSFVYPDANLQDFGIINGANILEVLAPSSNAGTYRLTNPDNHVAEVTTTVIEPVDESAFTFILSNIIYGNITTSIAQNDLVKLSDASVDFADLGVKTEWDVTNTPNYSGQSWQILIPTYSLTAYKIIDIVDGVLILDGDSNLPTVNTSGVTYTLLDDSDHVINISTTGSLQISRRGYISLNDPGLIDISEFIRIGDYLVYDGSEYLISEIHGNNNFWIDDYVDGAASGVSIKTKRILINNGVGYFGYTGLRLTTAADHEAGFGMIDGSNPPPADQQTDNGLFKENFMFLINDEFYKIASIDGEEVVLNGRSQIWTTKLAGGTNVSYSLVHFPEKTVNVQFTVFDQLNRNGKDPIIREITSDIDQTTTIVALSMPKNSSMEENIALEEGVSFTIQTRSGDTFEGEI